MKRIFDVVASGLGLIVLSPLFLILAIWIKLDSRGTVFYRQVRVGRYNKDFRILKFHSMRVGSDKGSLVTIGGHDPRITRSGYFIRKFKFDELPQLINVFIGDMSLVARVRRCGIMLITGHRSRCMCWMFGLVSPTRLPSSSAMRMN